MNFIVVNRKDFDDEFRCYSSSTPPIVDVNSMEHLISMLPKNGYLTIEEVYPPLPIDNRLLRIVITDNPQEAMSTSDVTYPEAT